MIVIDGSLGEGGGQILRSSLALSLVTGQPFRIENIRARRKKPGLMRQHLTAVEAAAAVGWARVEGVKSGSLRLEFHPERVVPGSYHFSVGTAGSSTLVLQTVLPALLTADSPSQLVLDGGTHNPHAPPFDFLARSFLPLLQKMGPKLTAEMVRPGFFPAGGGKFILSVEPVSQLVPMELRNRGPGLERSARAVVAGLPRHIAERELEVVRTRLGWDEERCIVEETDPAFGPGNVLLLEIAWNNVTEVFSGFGARGVRAENVAENAVLEVERFLRAAVPVGPHLADQLLLPLALAGSGSFRTLAPTPHLTTNAKVICEFLPVQVTMRELGSDDWEIRVAKTA
ncbi:MAG: RNA 3'-terminal phosphate cyclase [Syntrophotaleaceae bacterium]